RRPRRRHRRDRAGARGSRRHRRGPPLARRRPGGETRHRGPGRCGDARRDTRARAPRGHRRRAGRATRGPSAPRARDARRVALRPAVGSLAAPADAERRLADAVDRALTAEASELRTPTSFIWSLIGFGQYLVTGLLVFGALWLAALFVLHDAPSGSVDLPYLGPVPTPVVFIAAVLLAGYLLALALRYHAGWLGRRGARRVGALVAR